MSLYDFRLYPTLISPLNPLLQITITIIPKLEGQIHIAGAIYLIGGQIPTFKSFAKQMKTSTTGEFKTPRLNVTLPMPVLDVAFHSLPETLVSGEVARCVIEVTNKGNRGLKNLKVKLSHPQFFYFGSTMNMEQEPYGKRILYNFLSFLYLSIPIPVSSFLQ